VKDHGYQAKVYFGIRPGTGAGGGAVFYARVTVSAIWGYEA